MTGSIDITTPTQYALTFSTLPRRYFAPTVSNHERCALWWTFQVKFRRADRHVGKIIAHFPCLIIDKNIRKFEFLMQSSTRMIQNLPLS